MAIDNYSNISVHGLHKWDHRNKPLWWPEIVPFKSPNRGPGKNNFRLNFQLCMCPGIAGKKHSSVLILLLVLIGIRGSVLEQIKSPYETRVEMP